MKTYAAAYFGAAVVAMIVTPILSRLAKARGLVDSPGVRKVHDTPIPRIGGLAILVGTLALVLPVLFLDNTIGEAFRKVHREVIALLVAASAMYVVGLMDDLRSVRAPIKLVCLLGASLLVCLSGARFQDIHVGSWMHLSLGWASWPITVIWIVGITVGLNFIDGLDGLAAGIAAIVCGSIAAFAAYTGQTVMLVLMLALLGSLTGFLFFNFNPARIFMGDGGSMFLGFIIAAGSVVCQAKTHTLAGIGLPVLALGVPIFDTTFTMIRRRVLDRRSIFTAERGHIHHRLLDRGLRHPTVVIVIYGITLISAGIGILMMTVREGLMICLLTGGLLFLLVVFSLVGSARLKDTVTAIKRNRGIAEQVRHEKSCFEDAQLRMREIRSLREWWDAICEMAERMEFQRVALSVRDNGHLNLRLNWRRPGPALPRDDLISMVMPVRDVDADITAQLRVAIGVNGSLEAGGRRAALIGRLIDEHRPPRVAPWQTLPTERPANSGRRGTRESLRTPREAKEDSRLPRNPDHA